MSKSEQYVKKILKDASIELNGLSPADMRLHRERTINLAMSKGNLGLGESYMDGDWDADELDEFFYRLLRSGAIYHANPITLLYHVFCVKYLNLQTTSRSQVVAKAHYDLGNDFYSRMLDTRMTYTCGYWKHADTLEQAQFAKLDMICKKLKLAPGMRVLDIGCGWGSFMSHAAEHYGVECVGVTISKEQVEWGRQKYSHLPIEFRLQDYRELDDKFDCVASVGMFEHVGRKNHRLYMKVVNRCLKDEGLFLLHTIGKNQRNTVPDPWIDKYIFPNGDLPSLGQIGDAMDGFFITEDLHNFGSDYDKTLMAWCERFEAAWPDFLQSLGVRFYRMWRYYLLSCAGAFRARDIQLWQLVLSKKGVLGGYERVV